MVVNSLVPRLYEKRHWGLPVLSASSRRSSSRAYILYISDSFPVPDTGIFIRGQKPEKDMRREKHQRDAGQNYSGADINELPNKLMGDAG